MWRRNEFRRSVRVSESCERSSIAQLDVPVSQIDEVLPEIVLRRGKCNLNERTPFWSFGFADQAHVRFARKAIAFARIASDARANDVFPRRSASAITRHHVIQIEFASIENLTAVLAGVLVALEDIVARKLYFLFRKPIEHQQHNHPWDTDLERNSCNHLVLRRVRR
jgi:hypothetical protein